MQSIIDMSFFSLQKLLSSFSLIRVYKISIFISHSRKKDSFFEEDLKQRLRENFVRGERIDGKEMEHLFLGVLETHF